MVRYEQDKKRCFVTAAKELFGEFGYVETTFKKISERAGLPRLAHHHYD